jgi:glycogen phosphorylase
LGDGLNHGGDPTWDATEANQLYELLEQNIVKIFYERNEKDIPVRWVEMMRKSMSVLTPEFSANRTVREYTEKYYLPAAVAFNKRAENNGAIADKIIEDEKKLNDHWAEISIGDSKVSDVLNGQVFQVTLFFDAVILKQISVELFADGKEQIAPEKIMMQLVSSMNNQHTYTTQVTTSRSARDFTVRVVPAYQNVVIPLENNHILWKQ